MKTRGRWSGFCFIEKFINELENYLCGGKGSIVEDDKWYKVSFYVRRHKETMFVDELCVRESTEEDEPEVVNENTKLLLHFDETALDEEDE
jgi:hypothetical protein